MRPSILPEGASVPLPRADFGVRAIAMGGGERSAAAVVAGLENDATRPVVGKTKPFVEAKSASATNSPLVRDIASRSCAIVGLPGLFRTDASGRAQRSAVSAHSQVRAIRLAGAQGANLGTARTAVL